MEKKPSNRSVQSPGKGCGTELKKAQDNNGKQFPRSSRRREPAGANGARLDQSGRKPAPQKNKGADKRPQPRGQYFGGGKADSQVAEELAEELGLAFSPGSKKQSLNHLLNFHLAPRSGAVRGDGGGAGGAGRVRPPFPPQNTTRWLMSTHKHKYNKEQFLQANCQFVVRSDGDYSLYTGDPDILVNWDLIEQIRVLSSEAVNCPICLSEPVAGKITRCGHVFCWPCMLHYLALSDKTWRKCPICYESVHRHDLKSVLVLSRTTHPVGDKITFQLMKREKGSLVVSPVTQFDERANRSLLSIAEGSLDTVFSKLLTADDKQVFEIIEKEKKELDSQLAENEGCPELCFIEQALQLLVERKTALSSREIKSNKQDGDMNLQSPVSYECASSEPKMEPTTKVCLNSLTEEVDAMSLKADVTAKDLENEEGLRSGNESSGDEGRSRNTSESEVERKRYESVSSEGEDLGPTTITAEDLEINTHCPQSLNAPIKHFYFYQAVDGQHVYLHAINARMLEMTYGSLEQCPPLLSGVIVEKEAGSMTSELRNRLRYLQHLPLTCQFEVAEIELRRPIIDDTTVLAYKDQLEIRKHRRQKRARDERRREKKLVEVEHRQLGRFPTPRLRIESLHHFPQCGTDLPTVDLPPRPVSAESSRASSPISVRSRSPTPSYGSVDALAAVNISTSPSSSGPSFAQMLRDGSVMRLGSNNAWPSVNTKPKHVNQEPDIDGDFAAAPQYRQSFRDAFYAAPVRMGSGNSSCKDEVDGGGSKKKKKKQKVLLFATSLPCTGK